MPLGMLTGPEPDHVEVSHPGFGEFEVAICVNCGAVVNTHAWHLDPATADYTCPDRRR